MYESQLKKTHLRLFQMANGPSNHLFSFFLFLLAVSSSGQRDFKWQDEQIFPSHHRRQLSNKLQTKTTLHDITGLPAAPAIVTIPGASNPVSVTPTNPAETPVTFPATTSPAVPSTNPSNSAPPIINNPLTSPITVPGAQPVTNPATAFPPPSENVPVTAPVTNPVYPPASKNPPATPGQSWCVAKSGTSQTILQTALDYACGVGGVDCSKIQQGGICYNPNTLENHASYAFNSFYQKNPAPTSCSFGGSATIVNINPSTESCIYPSSSLSSSSPPVNSTPTPSTTIPTPTTPSGAAGTGVPPLSRSPPTVLNTSNPAAASGGSTTDFGFQSPPADSITSSAILARFRPFISCITLVLYFVSHAVVLDK